MNKNTVELLGYYGGDLSFALSAWTSTSRELTEEKKNRIPALLLKLATEGHHTPFEKSALHFLVTTDIASHIHLLKHRISSLNAESARYKELKEDKFYLPEDWTGIKLNPDLKHDEYDWKDILKWYNQLGNFLYHKSLIDITEKLGRKRAKETCRFFKPYSSQITADVMFNFRSFMNFQNLRNSEHAQKEIRDIAKEMLRLVFETNKFNHSLKAFGYERDLLGKVEKPNH